MFCRVRTTMMRTRTPVAGHAGRARLARWILSAGAVLALTGTQAADAVAQVASLDRTPPTFAGLKSATTCIPGPIDGQTASYQLTWDPATDDVTPSKQIVYDIYQATKSGGEDCSAPRGSVRAGGGSPAPGSAQLRRWSRCGRVAHRG
jgi:hypothetical protein